MDARFGIGRGDRVAILAPNSAAYVITIHALLLLRATVVPLNARLTDAERTVQCGSIHPVLTITDDAARVVPPGTARTTFAALLEGEPIDEIRLADPESGDLHSIVFTSGTTSSPRAVPLTWGNHNASALGSAANLGVRANDDWLCPLPLFHVGGLTIVHRSLLNGTALTVRDGFDPADIGTDLRGGRITLLSLVPTMLHRLFLDDATLAAAAVPSLRAVLIGGGPAGPGLFDACRTRGIPVLGTYGLTESCSQITTVSPQAWRDGLGTAGLSIGGAELELRDAADRPCPEGLEGEILIRGPMVSTGFTTGETQYEPPTVDGWLRTGDVGRLDGSGRLVVLGRRDDVIITGGENVRPEEIEAVLMELVSVAEAAVVGCADEEWGQRIVAVLVPAGPAFTPGDIARVEAHCRARLAGYKVPRAWMVATTLPRTAAGKLRRRALRDNLVGLSEIQGQRTSPT
jgi:o-succinylbenzoate---CoA ligase